MNFLFVVTYGKFYFRFLLLILPATAVAVVFFFLHSPDDDNDDDVNDVLIFFPLFQESISICFSISNLDHWNFFFFWKKRKKKKRKWLLGYWPWINEKSEKKFNINRYNRSIMLVYYNNFSIDCLKKIKKRRQIIHSLV